MAEGRLGNVTSFKPVDGESIYFFSREKGYLDFKGNNWTLIIKIKKELALKPVTDYGKKLLFIVIPIAVLSILLVIAFALFNVQTYS